MHSCLIHQQQLIVSKIPV